MAKESPPEKRVGKGNGVQKAINDVLESNARVEKLLEETQLLRMQQQKFHEEVLRLLAKKL